jgi:hypothetical protein
LPKEISCILPFYGFSFLFGFGVCGKLAAGSTGSAEQEDGDSPTPRYRPDGIDALCKATGL